MPANLVDLFTEYGFKVEKKTAAEWAAPCPACGGKDRCSVWPDEADGRGYYWCRQCDAKGDGIQFLRDFAGMSYQDACQRIGVTPATNLRPPTLPQRRQADRFEAGDGSATASGIDAGVWAKRAGDFVAWAADQLQKSPEQLAWLEERGISAEAAAEYRLGYNPGEKGKNCIIRPRSVWGLPPVMKDGKAKKFWLPRGIVIPQIESGEVKRIRIRRLDADRAEFRPEHKYHVVEGSGMEMLWLQCRTDSKVTVVVESELDAYMLHAQAGDMVSCASSMTSNVRKMSQDLLERFGEQLCILVALDSDKAGANGWPRWHESFARAKRWPVPAGKDPGEAFSLGENLRVWLLAGIPEGLRLSMRAGAPALEMSSQVEGHGGEAAVAEPEEEPVPEREADVFAPEIPQAVLEFAEMWRRIPITYRRILDGDGLPAGWAWECKAEWSVAHMEEKHAFLKFEAEHPEVAQWIAANPLTRITAANFLTWMDEPVQDMCATCAHGHLSRFRPPVKVKRCKGCVYNLESWNELSIERGDFYREKGVFYEN